MNIKSLVGPENQRVTFIELFFDLVFVFAITQTVGLLHDGITWTTVGQGILVFWLVWWAWTQFTWTLNAANTTNQLVELGILLATGVAFFMAVALPDAFHGRELAFAVPYVIVRTIGVALHVVVSWSDEKRRASVRVFATISIGGLAAVIAGGIAGGDAQYWLWGFAIVLDVVAAIIGGQQEGWELRIEHFSERHGLIVIIALGETLIVAAASLAGTEWTGELIAMTIAAVGITFALWWSYFPRAKPALDSAVEAIHGVARTKVARDVFSIGHFPMLLGVIAFAVVTEEVLAHPGDALHAESRVALAVGLLLFVGGMSAAMWRVRGRPLVGRAVIIAVAALLIAVIGDVHPLVTVGIGLAGVVITQIAEHWTGIGVSEPAGVLLEE